MSAQNSSNEFFGWCLIPPQVLAAKDLNNSQKILIGRINGLTSKHGYFYGSNRYLGEQIGMSSGTVANYISDASSKGYITVKVSKHEGGTDRRIYLNNMKRGSQISETGGSQINEQSNRDKSNRDKKEKYIKRKRPVESWTHEHERISNSPLPEPNGINRLREKVEGLR